MTVHTIDLNFRGTDHSIAAFAIADRSGDGYTLVECGPYSCNDRLVGGLQEVSIRPEQIHTLLLSHIHFDHAGAAWWWAHRGTQVFVHPRGQRHLISPERLYESARQIYGDRMDDLWGRMEGIEAGKVTALEDRATLDLGGRQWTAHHTPGHASHHIAWQVDRSVFTGDVGGCRLADGPVVPPCPPPDINRKEWKDSITRLRSLDADRFYLTHFGDVTNVDDHLTDLEDRLGDYFDWMLPHFNSGAAPEKIVPLFEQYVTDELKQAGVSSADLAAYMAANPPYMSVVGMLRCLRLEARA